MSTLPIIRLDIEGMRYQVIHALALHHTEVEEVVDREVKAAIDAFDFAGVVRSEATKVIGEAIRESLRRAVSRAFDSEDVSVPLACLTSKIIKTALDGAA